MKMSVDLLPLAVKVWEDGTSEEGSFLAYSAELKLVAGGKSPQEAKDKLVQIIEDILAEEANEGTLEDFLLEMGFKREEFRWIAPELSLVQIPNQATDL
jgi:hypothetical protein